MNEGQHAKDADMTKQNKADEQGDALTPGAIATMRELGCSEAQIEAQRQQAERERAAGGFSKYVRKAEAARLFSEAVGFHHEAEHMDWTEYDSRAEWLTAHGPSWDKPRTPEWWADVLATETAERQGWVGPRGEQMRLAARANNLRTLAAAADDLPPLQWPNREPWPKGKPSRSAGADKRRAACCGVSVRSMTALSVRPPPNSPKPCKRS